MDTRVNSGAIHLMLQGKGGVGKSTCSAFLAQYLAGRANVVCLDTDPVNHTLAAYKSLPVEVVELIEDGEVNSKRFDDVIVRVLAEPARHFVVDSGASSFIPLWNYILQNEVLGLLTASGRQVFVHTIVAGGGALLETIANLKALAETTSGRNVVVWVNEHEARVEMEGKKLHEMSAYKSSAGKIAGNVLVERRNPQTFGADLRKMISERLTFDEALARADFNVMERQRLAVVRRELYGQLDALGLAA